MENRSSSSLMVCPPARAAPPGAPPGGRRAWAAYRRSRPLARATFMPSRVLMGGYLCPIGSRSCGRRRRPARDRGRAAPWLCLVQLGEEVGGGGGEPCRQRLICRSHRGQIFRRGGEDEVLQVRLIHGDERSHGTTIADHERRSSGLLHFIENVGRLATQVPRAHRAHIAQCQAFA